ncbi:hypothetical protein B0J13DRAFT_110385 [Dactylonectria estremocensis]|uniref:NAD-dependent epimerase/dehydratase domain-containing protein n=1 Tax=Dactylonectria estremocensis TaxID=1079267 RepID=A0A9P9FDU8_9HYPO|nr:hypothetical protein B0J13DRAFT_110385 [Dactylonectria estremocensis]
MAPLNVLLTGATGYVGGSVLSTLLSSTNPLCQQLNITALVRKQQQAELLQANGVRTVIFRDLDDAELLTRVASEHDLVIHTASGFHLGSASALISGLGLRRAETGAKVHYIHTSGTWNFADSSPEIRGTSPTDFSDKDDLYTHLGHLEAQRPFSQRTTLLEVVVASERQDVSAYVFMPPDVYGQGTGFFNQHTMQLFDLAKSALDEGRAEYVDDGLGGAGHVHVEDLAALYEVILGRILSGKSVPVGRDGLFFTETGYHSWVDVSKRINEVGVQMGAWEAAEPVSISIDDAAERWMGGDREMLNNSFCLRNRTNPQLALELGWKPQKTDDDWQRWIEQTFKAVLNDWA